MRAVRVMAAVLLSLLAVELAAISMAMRIVAVGLAALMVMAVG